MWLLNAASGALADIATAFLFDVHDVARRVAGDWQSPGRVGTHAGDRGAWITPIGMSCSTSKRRSLGPLTRGAPLTQPPWGSNAERKVVTTQRRAARESRQQLS